MNFDEWSEQLNRLYPGHWRAMSSAQGNFVVAYTRPVRQTFEVGEFDIANSHGTIKHEQQ